ELTTMPGWAGSSWYYLRYMDPHNDKAFVSGSAVDYWKNVDLYIGGSEHATGHLLYVRFWTKFLADLGLIPFQEPAKKLVNQGMIQGRSLKPVVVPASNGITQFVSADRAGEQQHARLGFNFPVEAADGQDRLYKEELLALQKAEPYFADT